MWENLDCVLILGAYPLYAPQSGLYLFFFCFCSVFKHIKLIINKQQQQREVDDEKNEIKKKMVMEVGQKGQLEGGRMESLSMTLACASSEFEMD